MFPIIPTFKEMYLRCIYFATVISMLSIGRSTPQMIKGKRKVNMKSEIS